jgi:hypothetical protein
MTDLIFRAQEIMYVGMADSRKCMWLQHPNIENPVVMLAVLSQD